MVINVPFCCFTFFLSYVGIKNDVFCCHNQFCSINDSFTSYFLVVIYFSSNMFKLQGMLATLSNSFARVLCNWFIFDPVQYSMV